MSREDNLKSLADRTPEELVDFGFDEKDLKQVETGEIIK